LEGKKQLNAFAEHFANQEEANKNSQTNQPRPRKFPQQVTVKDGHYPVNPPMSC
jgi:hypothetical protein